MSGEEETTSSPLKKLGKKLDQLADKTPVVRRANYIRKTQYHDFKAGDIKMGYKKFKENPMSVLRPMSSRDVWIVTIAAVGLCQFTIGAGWLPMAILNKWLDRAEAMGNPMIRSFFQEESGHTLLDASYRKAKEFMERKYLRQQQKAAKKGVPAANFKMPQTRSILLRASV